MTSRERVLSVLNNQVPDSVPRAIYDVAIGSYNDSTIELFMEKSGKHPSECFRNDIRGKVMMPERNKDFQRTVIEFPEPDDVEKLLTPVITGKRMELNELRNWVAGIHKLGCAAVAISPVSDFETPFSIRGREQFFMDLGYQQEWLPLFLDRVVDGAVADAEIAAKAGADIFGIGDDLGSQRGLLISPDQWRELFKPRLKRIIDAVKNTNPETKFFLHSDGMIIEIIPDLIEIGVDILNPIQPEVMNPAEIKEQFGDKLVFFGAISVQHTLPFGTPEDVFSEVKLRMETIGRNGGYIMTPSHMVNADIPWENIVAFYEAADKYGNYK